MNTIDLLSVIAVVLLLITITTISGIGGGLAFVAGFLLFAFIRN